MARLAYASGPTCTAPSTCAKCRSRMCAPASSDILHTLRPARRLCFAFYVSFLFFVGRVFGWGVVVPLHVRLQGHLRVRSLIAMWWRSLLCSTTSRGAGPPGSATPSTISEAVCSAIDTVACQASAEARIAGKRVATRDCLGASPRRRAELCFYTLLRGRQLHAQQHWGGVF